MKGGPYGREWSILLQVMKNINKVGKQGKDDSILYTDLFYAIIPALFSYFLYTELNYIILALFSYFSCSAIPTYMHLVNIFY